MADLEILKTRLTEAEAAQHSLATGTQVVEVMRDGRKMRFNEANSGLLDGYIRDLRAKIGGLEDTSGRSRRRFMPAVFR